MQQSKINWPSPVKRKKMNHEILTAEYEPYALASYKIGHQITDFVGRVNELVYFRSIINNVVQFGKSKAVRLEGPAGVGKSTLFNYLKQSIERERTQIGGVTEFISFQTDIFSAYFEIQDQILEYRYIWRPLFETLVGNFTRETGEEIGLPEYIALKIIQFLLRENPTEVSLLIWDGHPQKFDPTTVSLRDITPFIMDNADKIVLKLQEYYDENARKLYKQLNATINNQNYSINRFDRQNIINLFRTLNERDEYLDNVMDADSSIFSTDDDLIHYFNSLMRYYICVTKKQPVLLVGIDEIAKSEMLGKEEFYYQLGNLFVSLRNKLNFTLFVFISTTEDWAQYDKVLTTYSDLNNQISDFMETKTLGNLPFEDVNLLFQKRMIRFWNRKPHIQHSGAPFYPFTTKTFDYVYRYKNQDLRLAIHLLRDVWRQFKQTQLIPPYISTFDVMRNIRQFEQKRWDDLQFRKFEWEVIEKEFNKPGRFSTNNSRSAAVERAFEKAWQIMMNSKLTNITSVKNNPIYKINHKRYRPDVLIGLNETMGKEFRRIIEFQVKMYRKDHYVELDHIGSSITLFENGYSDFVYFLISGKGLSPTAQEHIEELRRKYPDRIRVPTLTDRQWKYLAFLVLFEEIVGQEMDTSFVELIYTALSVIINQSPEILIQEVINLPVRQSVSSIDINIEEPVKIPSPQNDRKKILLDNFNIHHKSEVETSESKIKSIEREIALTKNLTSDEPTKTRPAWLDDFPHLDLYKEEICGICQYMQKREKGRYKGKFTDAVIMKNVIVGNPSLSKESYKEVVKLLYKYGYLSKVKSSHVFTEDGWKLYAIVKLADFKC